MRSLSQIVVMALAAYAVTAVIAISYVALPLRRCFRRTVSYFNLPWLVRFGFNAGAVPEPLIEDEADRQTQYETILGFDPISCRLCVGFWSSLFVCFFAGDISLIDILAVYGLSYCIVTWEKY